MALHWFSSLLILRFLGWSRDLQILLRLTPVIKTALNLQCSALQLVSGSSGVFSLSYLCYPSCALSVFIADAYKCHSQLTLTCVTVRHQTPRWCLLYFKSAAGTCHAGRRSCFQDVSLPTVIEEPLYRLISEQSFSNNNVQHITSTSSFANTRSVTFPLPSALCLVKGFCVPVKARDRWE